MSNTNNNISINSVEGGFLLSGDITSIYKKLKALKGVAKTEAVFVKAKNSARLFSELKEHYSSDSDDVTEKRSKKKSKKVKSSDEESEEEAAVKPKRTRAVVSTPPVVLVGAKGKFSKDGTETEAYSFVVSEVKKNGACFLLNKLDDPVNTVAMTWRSTNCWLPEKTNARNMKSATLVWEKAEDQSNQQQEAEETAAPADEDQSSQNDDGGEDQEQEQEDEQTDAEE